MNLKFKRTPAIRNDVGFQSLYYSGDINSTYGLFKDISDVLDDILQNIGQVNEEIIHPSLKDVINQIQTTLSKIYPTHQVSMSILENDRANSDSSMNNFSDDEPQVQISNLEDNDNNGDGWSELAPLLKSPISTDTGYPSVEIDSFDKMIALSVLSLIREGEESRNRTHMLKQIHLAEAYLIICDELGIDAVDPKDSRFGFSTIINDAVYHRLLPSPPSKNFVKEPIRAFRNASTNGQVIENIKVPDTTDLARVLDFYRFIPEGGKEYAMREMSNIGIREPELFTKVADALEERFPETVRELRRISRNALLTREELDLPSI